MLYKLISKRTLPLAAKIGRKELLATQMASESIEQKARARWNATLKTKMDRLGQYKHLLPSDFDYDTFDVFLKDLNASVTRRGHRQLALAAQPLLQRIRSFTGGISSMAQSTPLCSLVWGGLQILLEV